MKYDFLIDAQNAVDRLRVDLGRLLQASDDMRLDCDIREAQDLATSLATRIDAILDRIPPWEP